MGLHPFTGSPPLVVIKNFEKGQDGEDHEHGDDDTSDEDDDHEHGDHEHAEGDTSDEHDDEKKEGNATAAATAALVQAPAGKEAGLADERKADNYPVQKHVEKWGIFCYAKSVGRKYDIIIIILPSNRSPKRFTVD